MNNTEIDKMRDIIKEAGLHFKSKNVNADSVWKAAYLAIDFIPYSVFIELRNNIFPANNKPDLINHCIWKGLRVLQLAYKRSDITKNARLKLARVFCGVVIEDVSDEMWEKMTADETNPFELLMKNTGGNNE